MKFRFLVLIVIVLCPLAAFRVSAEDSDQQAKRDAIVVRAIERMEGYDYSTNKAASEAIERHIRRQQGTPEYLELIKRFRPAGVVDDLWKLVIEGKSDSDSVDALAMLLENPDSVQRVNQYLRADESDRASGLASLLGLLGSKRAVSILSRVAKDAELAYEIRSAAIRGLAANNLGAESIVSMAKDKSLPADTRLLAGGLLSRSPDSSVQAAAAKLLPQPARADQKPLPPLDQLATMSGNLEHGKVLFRGVATCSNCHVVVEHGKPVGPDLTEIGSKLSREAMFTSILDPSAGISHNFENHVVLLDSGQVIAGVMISETDDEVVLRTAEAIDRTIDKDSIEEMSKSEKSIMPENLHHTTDQQGLVDIVEYLMSLKKKS